MQFDTSVTLSPADQERLVKAIVRAARAGWNPVAVGGAFYLYSPHDTVCEGKTQTFSTLLGMVGFIEGRWSQ